MTKQISNKVPEIRFRRFKNEWVEEPILSRITKIIDFRGRTPKKLGLDWSESGYLALSALNVKDGYIDYSADAHFGDDQLYNVWMQGHELHSNQVLFTTEAPMGNVAQVPDNQKYILSQRTIAFVTDPLQLSEDYLATLLKSPSVFSQLLARSSGGTAKGVSQKSLSTLNVILSNDIDEQTKVGYFFKKLDQLIQLHQYKHTKLITLKQAMLIKMFPQKGANIPDIRFNNFTGNWEEKKLGDICEIVGGGTPSTSIPEYWNGDIDWYSPTEIGTEAYASGSIKKITPSGLNKCSAKILPAQRTILFTSRAGIGDMAILKKPGCTNQGFQSLVLHDSIDSYFIYSMGYMIKNYALKHASGSTFLEISGKQLKKMEIRVPGQDEQQKIGTYFCKLDQLISQHAMQLKKLRQIKSACLAKMFV